MPRKMFSDEVDLGLLIQRRADKPFIAEHGHSNEAWQSLCDNLAIGKIFLTPRGARDRYLLLVREFKKKESIN